MNKALQHTKSTLKEWREKLREALGLAKRAVLREFEERPQGADLADPEWFARVATGAMAKMDYGGVGEYYV